MDMLQSLGRYGTVGRYLPTPVPMVGTGHWGTVIVEGQFQQGRWTCLSPWLPYFENYLRSTVPTYRTYRTGGKKYK